MKTNDNEVYNRITELLSLLNNDETESSVKSISLATESAETLVRLDLQKLTNYGITIRNSRDTVSSFNALESRYDNDPLELSFEIPAAEQYLPHILFFENIKEAHLFQKHSVSEFRSKDSPLFVSTETLEHKHRIEKAAANGKWIRFLYRIRDVEHLVPFSIAPTLYYNATDDLWYCIHFTPEGRIEAFRLDRIQSSITEIEKPADAFVPNKRMLKRLDYIWGADFNNADKPVHVKILINNNTANILEKIKSDTANRKFTVLNKRARKDPTIPLPSVWQKNGSYYIFEDDIIGLRSFRSWLMTFGSSVKVLEPRELAEEIYLSSVCRLRNYEEGNCFHED